MAGPYIGRRESVGFGLEPTPGTSVAPGSWQRHTKQGFKPMQKTIDNPSALGRNEASDDSAVTQIWAEGGVEAKIGDISIGYLLANLFALPVTTDNADTNPVVKDHTFDVGQTQIPPTLTVARKTPVADLRHALCSIDSLEIAWQAGEWVTFTVALRGKRGASASNTVAYTDENEFISKHITAKLAANVAGLGAATALKTKSGKLTIDRPSELFFGTELEPSRVTVGPTNVTGEFVIQYDDGTYETLWTGNTRQAFQLSIVNTDVTIGASARPGLVFTLPKAKVREFDTSDDLDETVEQTLGLKGELDVSAAYMIRAVLTNTQAAYS